MRAWKKSKKGWTFENEFEVDQILLKQLMDDTPDYDVKYLN